MSDEKKKSTKTEQAENKKVEAKDESVKKETEKKIETKDVGKKVDTEVIKDDVKAVEEKKEEVKKAVEEDKAPDQIEVKDEKPVTESKSKSNSGNLNFYSEIRSDLPELRSGDIIRVSYRVVEGGKERIQIFEGTIIAMKNSGIAKTITVRKTSFGISIERIFPLNSKLVQKIEVKKHSKVRRAKLYYLRKLKGKAARLKELR